MEHGTKSRGGRPWSFDRDAAVETARRLFWRHGYEGVSVGDLTKAIGVAPPSLYAAFGSKAGLYQQAMTRYKETLGRLDVAGIGSAKSLPDAVRLLLEGCCQERHATRARTGLHDIERSRRPAILTMPPWPAMLPRGGRC